MVHYNLFFYLFLLYIARSESNAYRILAVFPLNLGSHNNMFESVTKVLARRGHQVDVISHFELKKPIKNYTNIINLKGTLEEKVNNWDVETTMQAGNTDLVTLILNECGNKICDLLSLEKIQKLLKNLPNEPAYDLVLTEALAANCFFGLGHALKVPVIAISTLLEFPWLDVSSGNPVSPAIAVSLWMENAQILTFWDRLQNMFLANFNKFRFFISTEDYQTAAMRKYLSPDIPSIREIEKNVALIFVNTYFSFFGLRPNAPALIPIGGIQVEQSEVKITPELKTWMDESEHGVVYFTLGSLVIIETLPKEKLLSIYASFAKIAPVRVLMKILDNKKLPPGLPDNVLTMSWIPQVPVLRHKNTRIFITHGGLNGIQEALYFGVPMIGIPLFGDQPLNINLLTIKNIGVKIEYNQITEKYLDEALNNLLYDPKYENAAKHASRLFRDRPQSATDTAIFWIEYIIRNGADSLKSPSVNLYWYQLELIDVYGFLIVCLFLFTYVIFYILKIVLRVLKYILSFCKRPYHKKGN